MDKNSSSALEQSQARLAALRAALIEGEASGASMPFDFDAFIARKLALNPAF